MEIFLPIVKKILFAVFDTQIAALFNGYTEPPSYKKLVQDFCKISLNKALQKEDWLKRPIDEIVSKLAYPDERKLIAKSGKLTP